MALPERCVIVCAITLSACMPQKNLHPDIHGHRGCRGLLPENSIPAFLKATEIGCDYLEMDVVVSQDGHLVISHEPWMDHRICLTPDDEPISKANERSHNLYRMSAFDIRKYDCGSLEHPDFPKQKQRSTYKPLLADMVEQVDEHAMMSSVAIPSFNIEIKSDPELYGTFQPQPLEFAHIVINTLDSIGVTDRCMLQSFDTAILEVIHAERPEIPLAYLVEGHGTLEEDLAKLSFQPSIYSPQFAMADDTLLQAIRAKGMELVVWTVNDPADIRRMLELGVDGIISDYPNRVIAIQDGLE